jgi:hypothetical protein
MVFPVRVENSIDKKFKFFDRWSKKIVFFAYLAALVLLLMDVSGVVKIDSMNDTMTKIVMALGTVSAFISYYLSRD